MNLSEYLKPALGVVCFAALAGGWYWFENRSPPEEKDTPVQALVVVTKSTNACFSDLVRVTGFVVPRREAVIGADQEGSKVTELFVREGDAVTENQEMARLSAPPQQTAAGRPGPISLKAPAAGLLTEVRTIVGARALKTAFELGLVDRLVESRSGSVNALGRALGTDEPGLRFLLDLLAANGVVEERKGDVRLSARFLSALRYRDLLETKLDFAGFTLNDFADLFTVLVRDAGSFAGHARLYQLFDYRRCLDSTTENYAQARAWMRITSTLTRYEARACMRLHGFGAYRRMLDVGGNSGEFVLQLCRRHPALRGTVLDLPLREGRRAQRSAAVRLRPDRVQVHVA